MRTLLKTLLILFLASPVYAATIGVKDEGSNQGYVYEYNCVGAGINCSRSGSTGVITIGGTITHADGANCSAGEIPLGVGADGAAQGCYEPAEADISDLDHTATAITDDLINAADLDATNAEADDDIITFDTGSGGFTFNSGPELCEAITGSADLCDGGDASGGAPATADISDVSVTQTELAELQTIGSTSISADDWTAVAALVGTNTGDNTIATSGDSATSFFSSGEIADAQISDTLTASNLVAGSEVVSDAEVVDTITASNYMPLAGGTFSGEVILDNLGVDFTDSDTNPTCAAGDYLIYADLSETTLKKCINGSASDLDTTGGTPATADISDVSVTQTEFAELETIGATTISAAQWTALGGATTAGLSVLDDANVAAMLVTLGLSATASEINTPLDGASVTLTEFRELETIGASVISADDWTAVAALEGTNTGDQTSVSGNAGTATALAADGADCSAGSAPIGVDASGAAESCTDYLEDGDALNGETITDNTIDEDSIDFGTGTDQVSLGDFTDDLGANPGHTHTTTSLSGIVNADLSGSAAITNANLALVSGTGLTESTNTINCDASSTSAVGCNEFATTAEMDTGTSATLSLGVNEFNDSDWAATTIFLVLLDDTTDTAVADGTADFEWVAGGRFSGYNIVDIECGVYVAGTTNTTDVQIYNVTQTADVLSTKCTIDTGETSSHTAAAAPVISGTEDDITTADRFRIDVDAVSTTAAKGLWVELTLRKP